MRGGERDVLRGAFAPWVCARPSTERCDVGCQETLNTSGLAPLVGLGKGSLAWPS